MLNSLCGSVEAAKQLRRAQVGISCVVPDKLNKLVRSIFIVRNVGTKAEPPRKAGLEGVEEKEENPSDDDTVVDANETVYDKASNSNPNEVWRDDVPCHDGALHGGLTEGQLQIEEGDTENEQHDHVR